MPLQYKQLQISDFSGGITDKHVTPALNEARELTNYFINEIGKPELTYGYKVIYDSESFQRIMGIFKINDDIVFNRFEHMYLLDPLLGTATQINGVNAGNPIFTYFGNEIFPNAVQWRSHLIITNTGQKTPTVEYTRPRLMYRDDLGALKALQAGLPFIQSPINVDSLFDPGTTFGYLYAFHYSYEYEVGNDLFQSVGPVYFTDRETKNVQISAGSPMDLTGIDLVGISPAFNQIDVVNVKLNVYRSIGNGTTYFKLPLTTANPNEQLVGEYNVTNLPSGLFPGGIVRDFHEDSVIEQNAVIYAQVSPEKYSAPKCKYVTVASDATYFMNCIAEEQDSDTLAIEENEKPYRVYQSVLGNPNMVDPTAFVDLDDDIIGGGSLNGIAIVMTESKIYRIEGQIDAAGNGTIRKKVISDTAGCVSHRSIIVANDRMYWAGNNGFYTTDGFNVILLTKKLLTSYNEITDSTIRGERIVGSYDDRNQRIFWGTSDNDTENNFGWVLNIKSGGGFSQIKGENMLISSILSDGKDIYRGDELGYIYSHNDLELNHYTRDITKPASQWEKRHIPYRLETSTLDMGNKALRKWGKEATVTFKSSTNSAILPKSNNNDDESLKEMVVIRIASTWLWRDENVLWLDPEITWRNSETITKQRHFPRGHSRYRTKSVILEPAKTNLYKSDFWGEADLSYVNPSSPSDIFVTMQGTDEWPTEISADKIVFEEEGYDVEHSIISRTNQVLTISGGALNIGPNKKWHIVGYRKQVTQEIKDITITYADMDNVGNRYDSTEAGSNE